MKKIVMVMVMLVGGVVSAQTPATVLYGNDGPNCIANLGGPFSANVCPSKQGGLDISIHTDTREEFVMRCHWAGCDVLYTIPSPNCRTYPGGITVCGDFGSSSIMGQSVQLTKDGEVKTYSPKYEKVILEHLDACHPAIKQLDPSVVTTGDGALMFSLYVPKPSEEYASRAAYYLKIAQDAKKCEDSEATLRKVVGR